MGIKRWLEAGACLVLCLVLVGVMGSGRAHAYSVTLTHTEGDQLYYSTWGPEVVDGETRRWYYLELHTDESDTYTSAGYDMKVESEHGTPGTASVEVSLQWDLGTSAEAEILEGQSPLLTLDHNNAVPAIDDTWMASEFVALIPGTWYSLTTSMTQYCSGEHHGFLSIYTAEPVSAAPVPVSSSIWLLGSALLGLLGLQGARRKA